MGLTFQELVTYFSRLEETPKRLAMFDILAELFRRADLDEIDKSIYLLQGELLPAFHGVTLGLSEKYLLRAIARVAQVELACVAHQYRLIGDLGLTAENYISGRGRDWGVVAIYEALSRIAAISGEGSVEGKIDAVSDLLASVSGLEARYLIRFLSGRLRLGVGDATLSESLALAKGDRAMKGMIDRAYNLTSDLGLTARLFFERGPAGVTGLSVRLGYPIRPALCERLISPEEMIKKMGRCAIEAKYDGLRCQVHQGRDEVVIFSRNQERTTGMFPEIVAETGRMFAGQSLILEGEALAYNEQTGDLLPFQVTIQRKRKHDVQEMARDCPLKFYVFDLLYLNGVDYTQQPYAIRRKKLTELIGNNPERGEVMMLAEAIETEDPKCIQQFFDTAVEKGLEGIIAKRLDAPYSAGARNFNWIKLKRSYKGELADSVDLCIIGYYSGKGHRARFGIGTILCAGYDSAADLFKSVSKIGTGFSEEEWVRLKGLLDEAASTSRPANVDSDLVPEVWVHPKYVITVTADEITRSPNHTAGRDAGGAGYALRFPRVQGFIREDKRAEDATSVSEIVAMFNRQRPVRSERGSNASF